MCRIHSRYWQIRLQRLRHDRDTFALRTLAQEILLEIPDLVSHELVHWAVLHQVCAAALILVGSGPPGGSDDTAGSDLVGQAELYLLHAAPGASIATKSLEAIARARSDAQGCASNTAATDSNPTTAATAPAPLVFEPAEQGPSANSEFPWILDPETFPAPGFGLESLDSAAATFPYMGLDSQWMQ